MLEKLHNKAKIAPKKGYGDCLVVIFKALVTIAKFLEPPLCYMFVSGRAGKPEPECGAMEPANFGGAGAGARAFLNISVEPELEPQKFC